MVSLTSELSEIQNLHKNRLPKGVKFPPPSGSNEAIDGDSIKSFFEALENYLDFIIICNSNQWYRFVEALLQENA